MKTFLASMRRFNVVLVLISSSGLLFGQVHSQPQQRQHQALNHPANFNQYPPIQNIFGNLFRPGATQPLIPSQHPQFHPNAPNVALPPPPPLPPQSQPHQGNTAAPVQPPAQGSNVGQQPGNRRQPPPPPPPPPLPPGPATRSRLPQGRTGPQRNQPRQQRPPPPHPTNSGRNPPPPPVPHTQHPPLADTSNGPNVAPLNSQIISLTSNFGEEPVSYETTTYRKDSLGSIPASTTEFTPSPTHIINFEFDGEPDPHIGQDVVYDTFASVNPDLVSNDLSLVAPPSDHVEKQVNDLEQDQLPFKLTPRGHSAPVIISQIPFKSTQTSNQVVKEPMPEAVENRRQETTYFDGEDLSPSDTLLSEQVYKQDKPQSDGEPPNPSGDTQRIQAKANSNFYFRSDNNPTPHSSEAGEDSKPGRTNRLLNHHHQHHHTNHSHNVISLTESEEVQKTTPEEEEQVRGLVDCGGRDLGFCDMSSKYPGHMMGNLMSDCQELVYRGFVPVPEDLEELGDSDPVAKYSNSSKSAVRAQTGSWSWKPYAFKKKQVCDSELRFIRPGYARDSTGKWQVIVQTEELPQRVAIDLCHSPDKPCRLMSDCGQKSKCLQRYNFQHLLAVDPDNLHDCPTIRAFKFPSACVCHIEYPDYF